MANRIIDSCLNLEIFKSGAKLSIYELAGLGLIYSFFTQGIIMGIFLGTTWTDADDLFILTAIRTYIITYLTTAVALVWGLHIHELRFFKLWGFIKFVEVIFNITSFIGTIFNYRLTVYIPVIVFVQALGTYVIMSVWNLYKNIPDENNTYSEEKNINFTLPNYEEELPAVHKTTVIN